MFTGSKRTFADRTPLWAKCLCTAPPSPPPPHLELSMLRGGGRGILEAARMGQSPHHASFSPRLVFLQSILPAQKGTRLIWRGRHRDTLKLIKRFSKAICFPLGPRFDNQTNSSLSAPLTSIFATSVFITINYLLSSNRTHCAGLVKQEAPRFWPPQVSIPVPCDSVGWAWMHM